MTIKDSACPLCNQRAELEKDSQKSFKISRVWCDVCGHYVIDSVLVDHLIRSNTYESRFKLAVIAAERKIRGREKFFLQYGSEAETVDGYEAYDPITVDQFRKEYPRTQVEVFDRILENLSIVFPKITDSIDIDEEFFEDKRWLLHSSTTSDVDRTMSILEEMGVVTDLRQSSMGCMRYGFSYLAWERLRSIQSEAPSHTAFLAMWFDSTTAPIRDAVRSAVRGAGYSYQELTVDEVHHNDFIMDKVINLIVDAKFVIADFTCAPETPTGDAVRGGVRGGVYFEAGLARGLHKQVIHTCRDDNESKSRLHFDIGQINTLFWRENQDGNVLYGDKQFADVLKERIIATVGMGPLGAD